MSPRAFPRFEELPYPDDSSRYFDALKAFDWPVFLDSGGHPGGRSDVIAAAPWKRLVTHGRVTRIVEGDSVTESDEDPFGLVRAALGEPAGDFSPLAFEGGAIGYFGYDLGRRIEKLPVIAADRDALPEMMIAIYDWAVVVDHELRQAWLVAQGRSSQTAAIWDELLERLKNPVESAPGEPLHAAEGFVAGIGRDEYRRQFGRIQAWIRAGDCYQVNYAQRFAAHVAGDGWRAYREMRAHNPVPFGAFLRLDDIEILSFSPERFLKLERGRITTQPIKGTRPRGSDPQEDARLRRELSRSAKDRAENLMIVDLLRNDLGRVCEPGSIGVRDLFEVESFPTVHHMVSTVSGRLREGEDALSLLRASFPGGSITGAPKIRAMEIIEELEPCRRGIYCGAIGYIGFNGDMDTSIVIRTLVRRGEQAHYWVGGGIVADSDPDAEYQECLDKARAFQRYFSPVD
ncbi:MAG: aminodeoxychorismate synthase component I [Gammaproteobacteria bacterium]